MVNFLLFPIQKLTRFELTDEMLICRTLFYKKEIPLKTIRNVEKNNGFYAGLKFSTSFSGLVVSYNKFDEVFITPENEQQFIEFIHTRKKDS